MSESKSNRGLPAEQVMDLVKKNLPTMVAGLGTDRSWLWWSGPKPGDAERATLGEIGFQFTRRPHLLPDGREAHWYHACGGYVKRTRKSGSTRQHRLDSTEGRDISNRTRDDDSGADVLSDLERIAAAIS